MKYKVLAGTDTFNKLSAVLKRIDESHEVTKQIVAEIGAEEWLNRGSECVAGEIGGFRFKRKPHDWKSVYSGFYTGFFFPKSTKQNKALLERIAAIPKVPREDVNDCVGFKKQWVGLTQLSGIGVNWGKTFHLVIISEEADEYTPTADMIELTVSEYKQLALQLKQEKEVADVPT